MHHSLLDSFDVAAHSGYAVRVYSSEIGFYKDFGGDSGVFVWDAQLFKCFCAEGDQLLKGDSGLFFVHFTIHPSRVFFYS